MSYWSGLSLIRFFGFQYYNSAISNQNNRIEGIEAGILKMESVVEIYPIHPT